MKQHFDRLLFDAHCHAQTAMELRKSSLVSHFALMSSMESDWPAMRDLSRSCREQQHVVFGAGIHPWFAHKAAMGYEERLEAFLEENPTAFVGEIGLDKVAKTPETNTNEWQAQLDVFEAQMRIAAKMKRVVSLHCVQVSELFVKIAQVRFFFYFRCCCCCRLKGSCSI